MRLNQSGTNQIANAAADILYYKRIIGEHCV